MTLGSISVAVRDPAALLAEVTLGCRNAPGADPRVTVLEIRGTTVHRLLSGKALSLPSDLVW
jgi:hypothetical protein